MGRRDPRLRYENQTEEERQAVRDRNEKLLERKRKAQEERKRARMLPYESNPYSRPISDYKVAYEKVFAPPPPVLTIEEILLDDSIIDNIFNLQTQQL